MFKRRIPHTPRRLRARGKNALHILLMTVPVVFNIALVSFLTYYTVVINKDNPEWTIIAIFVDAQLVLNWLQFLRNQAIIRPSKKNFPGMNSSFELFKKQYSTHFKSFSGYVHRFPSLTNSRDTREINDEFVEAQRTWKECDVCDMHIPLRTYHCSLCNACISIPDHRKDTKIISSIKRKTIYDFLLFFQIATSWVNVLEGPTKDFSYVSHFTPALALS